MSKRTNLMLSAVLLVFSSGVLNADARAGVYPSFVPQTQTANDREQDGLSGPVRRVKTETAKITTKNGKPFEGPRVVLETATYDIKGGKVDHAYFLAAGGALTGKEVYKYDDKGNIVEMTLHHADGTLLTKEVYSYEFDQMGNWTKMVTSVAVIEGGKMTFEPTEVTYRTLSYFLDEAMMAKMAQPAAATSAPASSSPANAGTVAANTTPTAPNPSVASNAQPSNTNAGSSSQAKVGASPAGGAPVVGSKPVEKAAERPSAGVASATNNGGSKSEQKLASAPPPVAAIDRMNAPAPSNNGSNAGAATPNGARVVSADTEAPARPVARGPVKPVSGGILNGKAVKLPAPEYPEVARRQRTMGMVTVEVVVDVTGRVISAKAVGGPIILQPAAEKAALLARFSPTLLSGQPVKVSGQITYNFTIQ